MCSACSGNVEDPDMTVWEEEPEPKPDEAMLAMRAYLSAVKRFGEVLQQLGKG